MSENPVETSRRSLKKKGGAVAQKNGLPNENPTVCLSVCLWSSVYPPHLSLHICVCGCVYLYNYIYIPISSSNVLLSHYFKI